MHGLAVPVSCTRWQICDEACQIWLLLLAMHAGCMTKHNWCNKALAAGTLSWRGICCIGQCASAGVHEAVAALRYTCPLCPAVPCATVSCRHDGVVPT
jgi:hypothetical protein